MADKVLVSRAALDRVLSALLHDSVAVRELQATLYPRELFKDNPINTLYDELHAEQVPATQLFAEELFARLKDSGVTNYLEDTVEVTVDETQQRFSCTVILQQPDRPTPHELRVAAERKVGQAAALLERIRVKGAVSPNSPLGQRIDAWMNGAVDDQPEERKEPPRGTEQLRMLLAELQAHRVDHGRQVSGTVQRWAGKLGAALDELHLVDLHSVGEAASAWLEQNDPDGLDWCDARNVDALLAALPLGNSVVAVDKYSAVLDPFMAMMRKELHANAHKGDRPAWLKMTPSECLLELYYHAGKLQKAAKDNLYHEQIPEYAADVANICMMLLDIYGHLGKQPGTLDA